MKKVTQYTTFGLSLLSAGSTFATTILIDYDDGIANEVHDVSVKAGDFNDALAISSAGWDLSNIGAGAADFETDNPSGVGSVGNLAIGFAINAPVGPKIPGISTGATIALGQTFDLSFMWRDAFNWDDGQDRVSMVFFYTADDLIGGTATDVLTLQSELSTANNSYQTESASGQAYDVDVTAGVGKTLFVRFDTTAESAEFARLDNVFVAVTAVPEPSSSALLGLGGLALILHRRK